MSTSSISAAPSRTSSGTRSLTGAPVMVATASAIDSRCWMFRCSRRGCPASRSTSISCQRFSRADPGALVWASSSTRATAGGGPGSRPCPSPRRRRRGTRSSARDDLQAGQQRLRARPTVRLHEAHDEVRPTLCVGGPPPASGRSCRLPAPCRDRPQVAPVVARGGPLVPGQHLLGSGSIVEARVGCGHFKAPIQVEVEFQDVHARLAQEPEQRAFRVRETTAALTSASAGLAPRRPGRPGIRPPPG